MGDKLKSICELLRKEYSACDVGVSASLLMKLFPDQLRMTRLDLGRPRDIEPAACRSSVRYQTHCKSGKEKQSTCGSDQHGALRAQEL